MKGLLRWEAGEEGQNVAPVSDLVKGEREECGSGRLKSSQFWLYFKCGKPRSQLPVGMGPQEALPLGGSQIYADLGGGGVGLWQDLVKRD